MLNYDVLFAINKKPLTVANFIDLDKAFDTVNHKTWLKKLTYKGVQNNTIE